MSIQIRTRRGSTVNHSTFTGASGELTVDTTKNTVVVHDGATVGGIPLAKENNPVFGGDVGVGATPSKPVGFTKFVAIGDSDSGIGQISDGVISIANNGVERVRVDNAGKVTFTSSDNATQLLLSGTTKGVRIFTNAIGGAIEGIDKTGVGAYQPMSINGSEVGMAISGTSKFALTSNTLFLKSVSTEDNRIVLGEGRAGNGNSYIDLVSDATYSAYGLRIIRTDSGANSPTFFAHRGTGDFWLKTEEAASIVLATSNLERVRVNQAGDVLIGHGASIGNDSNYYPPLQVTTGDTNSSGIAINSFSGGGTGILQFRQSKSVTKGAHTLLTDGSLMGRIEFLGSNGSAFKVGASIRSIVEGATSATSMPAAIRFDTTTVGSAAATERLRIDPAGNVLVKSAGLLGYGTGSGGTVTQVTNKATSVTLHKPSGVITTTADAVPAGATAVFILYNDKITATSCMDVTPQWDASNVDLYDVSISAVGIGAARVRIKNISGSSLSESLKINFVVTSGSAS